jgi:hypothetical protein
MENEIIIELKDLIPTIRKMAAEKARLATATCLDLGDKFEVLYHFEPRGAVDPMAHIRVRLAKTEPLPSISGIYACAVLVENEMMDDFNIQVNGISLNLERKMMRASDSPEFLLQKTAITPKQKNGEVKP